MKTLLAALILLPSSALAARPNIVVILADDMGYGDVGFTGCRDIPTPNIDSLARNGVRFVNGYVSHPFCSPTRAGLMTGRYQQRFGHENNPAYEPENTRLGLPLDQKTIAQVLKSAGYATGAVGKWHLGAAPQFHPNRRGFDEYFGFIGGGHDYLRSGGPAEYQIPIVRNGTALEQPGYLTDAFSREAADFVRRHREHPFFLYLAYNAVHTPMHATERYLERFASTPDEKRRTYSAMLAAMDDGVGELLAALRDAKVEDDTLIFFLSDNGGPLAINGSTNAPLRGAKGQVYEGGIHVPLVAQWKARLPKGTSYGEPVISLDIFPTAVAAAGAKLPAGLRLDGVDVLPHVLGKKKSPPHEALFWRAGAGVRHAVRRGRYKLVHNGPGPDELYDLAADLGETKDLAAEKGEVLVRLQKAYALWNSELVAPLWENPGVARQQTRPPATDSLPNTLSDAEKKQGWRLLFDGKTLDGWRRYGNSASRAPGWLIEDGCLRNPKGNGRPGSGGGGDLLTVDLFIDFDLRFEWRLAPGGNSGVKYFVVERLRAPGAVMYAGDDGTSAVGFEYQLIDDERHPDAANGPIRQTGALYSLAAPSAARQTRPAGEFNESRIVVEGNRVEHWLNGAKIVEYDLTSQAFLDALARSKYKTVPGFGTKRRSPILLQDHGEEVWFRNLKIRPVG